jgi:hypothetical protein
MPFTKWDDDLGMTAHMGMFAVKGQVYGFMGSSPVVVSNPRSEPVSMT